MSTPVRICDVMEPWVERSPEHIALVDATGSWTYRQLAQAVSDTQAWLRASSVRPGDRVMVMGENCRAFAAVLLAVARLDAWCIPVNPRLSAREIDAIRDHCDSRHVASAPSRNASQKSFCGCLAPATSRVISFPDARRFRCRSNWAARPRAKWSPSDRR